MNWKLGTALGASCHFAAFCLKYMSPLELGSDLVKHPLWVFALKRSCQEYNWGLQRGRTFCIPSTLNLESSSVSLFPCRHSSSQLLHPSLMLCSLFFFCPPTGPLVVDSWLLDSVWSLRFSITLKNLEFQTSLRHRQLSNQWRDPLQPSCKFLLMMSSYITDHITKWHSRTLTLLQFY